MKFLITLSLLATIGIYGSFAHSSDEHSDNKHHEHEEDHAHSVEEHDNHSDEPSNTMGPDKGITEKAEAGFKLSAEALATMQIKSVPYSGEKLMLPTKSLVQIKDEKSVFRIRNGWIKRVSIQILKNNSNSLEITSKNFRDEDQIVIEGTGFLRISEIFSEEGASHGHSH